MKLHYNLLVLVILLLSSCCNTQKAVIFYVEPSAHSVTIIDSKRLDTVYNKKGTIDSLKIVYRKYDCKHKNDPKTICLKKRYYNLSLKRTFFEEKKIVFKPKKGIRDTIYFE